MQPIASKIQTKMVVTKEKKQNKREKTQKIQKIQDITVAIVPSTKNPAP